MVVKASQLPFKFRNILGRFSLQCTCDLLVYFMIISILQVNLRLKVRRLKYEGLNVSVM